jgi:hypothetical protein
MRERLVKVLGIERENKSKSKSKKYIILVIQEKIKKNLLLITKL